MLWRFSRLDQEKIPLHMKLVASLTLNDFMYSIKWVFVAVTGFSGHYNAFSVTGTLGCYFVAWVTALFSYGTILWNFCLTLNLFWMLWKPISYFKFSKNRRVLLVYNCCIWSILFLWAFYAYSTDDMGLQPNLTCGLTSDLRNARFIIFPVWIFSVFTVGYTLIRAQVHLVGVGNPALTRCIVQMIWFTLAFMCLWFWYLINLMIENSSPIVQLCTEISLGLVGFVNSIVWRMALFTRRRFIT
jgi:hypothetical protein